MPTQPPPAPPASHPARPLFPATLLSLVLASTLTGAALGASGFAVDLSSLDLTKMSAGFGKAVADKSIAGTPLTIAGVSYEKGVGTHAPSVMHVALNKGSRRFTSFVGVTYTEGNATASVCFKIYVDQNLAFDSGTMKAGQPARLVNLDLRAAESLDLVVTDSGDGIAYDHAAWAMAKFEVTGKLPVAIDPPVESEYILTPMPGPQPRLNGPLVFGSRPGNPFFYRIPATGERPMRFSAGNLPPSLTLDPATGIVTGNSPAQRGDYAITFTGENARGKDSRRFKLAVGDLLALTPPMGWNSWYIHYGRVNDHDIRVAADAMIASGMADYGYMYVNIDDYWSKEKGDTPYRDGSGRILPNDKFPDMRSLTDSIHAKGLRTGIYTSPGPLTCGNCVASYQHEKIDIQQFAEWGFDFVKHDWCSYGTLVNSDNKQECIKPYALMGGLLKDCGRDVVYNLCQYGMANVWEWGAEVDGNCWRTTGDLGPMTGGWLRAGLMNADHHASAMPGRWNDPDYILIGWVGDADTQGHGKKTSLLPSQQYQYMSMWSLMASPLIFSGDMTKLDAFTRNVLCNREVIDINQDTLGKQGRIVERDDEHFIMVKDLADGSKAVGIFNTSVIPRKFLLSWEKIGIKGAWKMRDVWRQSDLGTSSQGQETTIRSHGITFLRLSPAHH